MLSTQLRGNASRSAVASGAPRLVAASRRTLAVRVRASASPDVEAQAPASHDAQAHASASHDEVPKSSWRGKVLVAGATGRCGKRVVEELTARGLSVRALVRDTDKGRALAGVGSTTEVVRGDVFQFGSLPPALEDCTAVICCTGAKDASNPLGPFNVDYQGTLNLIAASKQRGVKHFVLITSIGADELINPLNLFWGVLFWKKRAEEELQRSGLTYTIVRPGGLKSELKEGERAGNVTMAPAGTYGFPPLRKSGAILRSQVAAVCVAALTEKAAANKVVEVIAEKEAPVKTMGELFAGVSWF